MRQTNRLVPTLLAGIALAGQSTAETVDEGGVQRIAGSDVAHELSVDLNDDRVADRLIASTDCGNAGCTYFCFVRLGDNEYRFVGQIFLHRLGFEVLKTEHNGLSDILSYSRVNAAEGSLLRHAFNGAEYEIASSVTGSSGLFDLLIPSAVGR